MESDALQGLARLTEESEKEFERVASALSRLEQEEFTGTILVEGKEYTLESAREHANGLKTIVHTHFEIAQGYNIDQYVQSAGAQMRAALGKDPFSPTAELRSQEYRWVSERAEDKQYGILQGARRYAQRCSGACDAAVKSLRLLADDLQTVGLDQLSIEF